MKLVLKDYNRSDDGNMSKKYQFGVILYYKNLRYKYFCSVANCQIY